MYRIIRDEHEGVGCGDWFDYGDGDYSGRFIAKGLGVAVVVFCLSKEQNSEHAKTCQKYSKTKKLDITVRCAFIFCFSDKPKSIIEKNKTYS